MGLAEKRAVQGIKEGSYKTFESEIKKICGFDIKLNFDWAALENHADCVWICENNKANDYMFELIATAVKSVCTDDMGKIAMRERVKEISMFPVAGDMEFNGGVLAIKNDLGGNGVFDAGQIQAFIEKQL